MKHDEITLVTVSNDNYLPGLLVTLLSLIRSSKSSRLIVYIMDTGITDENWQWISKKLCKQTDRLSLVRKQISQGQFSSFPSFFEGDRSTYSRLLIPNIVEREKVIYLDSDLLLHRDVSDLWNISLDGDICLAAVEDRGIKRLGNDCTSCELLSLDPDSIYFNAGVMLIDLSKWRKMNVSEQCIDFLNNYSDYCSWLDQSAMNVVLNKHIKIIDKSWNYSIHEFDQNPLLPNEAFILHYMSWKKPWLYHNYDYSNLIFYSACKYFNIVLTDKRFLMSRLRNRFSILFLITYYLLVKIGVKDSSAYHRWLFFRRKKRKINKEVLDTWSNSFFHQ